MLASPHALWFTQMIEYEVPSMCQQALAQALVARSEALAARCEGLQGVSIQASDDGVLHCQVGGPQAYQGA